LGSFGGIGSPFCNWPDDCGAKTGDPASGLVHRPFALRVTVVEVSVHDFPLGAM